MNISMIATIKNIYPDMAKTLSEGASKAAREKGQTRMSYKNNSIMKNRFLDAVNKDNDLINTSGPELAEIFGVTKTTINIWKKECFS